MVDQVHVEDEQQLPSGLVELLLRRGLTVEVGQLPGFGGEATAGAATPGGEQGEVVVDSSAVGALSWSRSSRP